MEGVELSADARRMSVSCRTAFHWFRNEHIRGQQIGADPFLMTEPISEPQAAPECPTKVASETLVSGAENDDHLDEQAKHLPDDGSAIIDHRPPWPKRLTDLTVTLMPVEPKDRLTRCGFKDTEQRWQRQARRLEVIRHLGVADAERGQNDLIQDFGSIVTLFRARLDDERRSKRRTESLIAQLAEPAADPVG